MADSTVFERSIAVLKSLVEIGAIFVGGWWAYEKFIRTEEPSTVPHFHPKSTLTWHKLSGSSNCIAELQVEVQNKSKSTIDIHAARRQVWSIAPPQETSGTLHFDAMSTVDTSAGAVKNLEDFRYEKGPLVQRYPPEGMSHHTFTWFVKAVPATYTLFRVELRVDPNSVEPDEYVYDWGPTCDSAVRPSRPQATQSKR